MPDRWTAGLQIVAVDAWQGLCNIGLWIFTHLFFFRKGKRTGERILVIKTGAIGDVVVSVPALVYQKSLSPNARIVILTATSGRRLNGRMEISGTELIANTALCERVIPVPVSGILRDGVLRNARREVKEFAPDRVVILPSAAEPAAGMAKKLLLLLALGVRVRPEGWRLRSNVSMFPAAQYSHGRFKHQVIASLQAMGRKDAPTPADAPCMLPEDSAASHRVGQILSESGVPVNAPYAIFGISAKRDHKRWPEDRFASVAETLHQRFGWIPVSVGGPGDTLLGDRFTSAMACPAVNLCGKLSLRETVELARGAKLFVGNDSGASHLAAAAQIPVVTIFSGIHFPGFWEPWTEYAEVVRHDVPCSPCFCETHCPIGSMQCIREITTEQVLDSIERVLHKFSSVSAPLHLVEVASAARIPALTRPQDSDAR